VSVLVFESVLVLVLVKRAAGSVWRETT